MMTAIYIYPLFLPEQITTDATDGRVYDSIDEALTLASTMDKDQTHVLIIEASKAFDTSFIVVFISIVCLLLVSTLILQRMLRPLTKRS